MAEDPKQEESLQVDNEALPKGLDLLDRDQQRSNLPPQEVFKRHPALTMIAQILTDFISNKVAVNPDDIEVSLLERRGASGISFSSPSHMDGAVSSDINDDLMKAFEIFSKTARLHGLDENNGQLILMPENFFIGGPGGKMGIVQFLYALAQDHNIHIGIDMRDQKRKQIIGHFTLDDVIGALEDEQEQRENLVKKFAETSAPPAEPANELEDMIEVAKLFAASLDRAMGGQVFRGNFYTHLNGTRLNIIPNGGEPEHLKKVDAFFEKLEGMTLPPGAKCSREYWTISFDTKDTLEQVMNISLAFYPTPQEQIPEAGPDDVDGKPLLWDRAEATKPIEGILECLYGLGKFHYDTGDVAQWIAEYENDTYLIKAQLPDDGMDYAQNIEEMLGDLQTKGGDWEGLSVLPQSYAIEISNLKIFPLMMEKYAIEEGVYFGNEALEKCPMDNYDADEELGAAFALEGSAADPENPDDEADELQDTTLLNMLGNRQYAGKAELRKDAARLLRLIESDIYGGPVGPNEILKMLWSMKPENPEQEQMLESLRAPAPGTYN